jgi:dipeptidyl-peptidase 4
MSFPYRYARTQHFTLGVPRLFTIGPDGARILFCRSRSGTDPVSCLWEYEVATGTERLVFDPARRGVDADADQLPLEERIRRERSREQASGVTQYATDVQMRWAVFALGGQLWLVDLATGTARELPATTPVIDPRLDPTGRVIAYVSGGALRVIGADGTGDRTLATPEGPDVGYGLADHVAAESMHRQRGFWWAPDGQRLLVARVDNSPVQIWYLSNPADPASPARAVRYPVAGTSNAEVGLCVLGVDGSRVEVDWDTKEFEYVPTAGWDRVGPIISVQNRSQSVVRVLSVDPDSGRTNVIREDRDAAWVTLVPGVPARTEDGQLVATADRDDTRRLVVDGEPVTPVGLQVREVLDVDGGTVLFAAATEPTDVDLWTWSAADGPVRVTDRPGWHHGQRSANTTVIVGRWLDQPAGRVTVRGPIAADRDIESLAEPPGIQPRLDLFEVGEEAIRVAVLVPTGHVPGSASLPVLMDPYGGPAAQRVRADGSAYLASQWFADQGFIVVIADGHGTPGRGPAWERSILRNKGGIALDDQVLALHATAQRYPDMDLSRVGIRGWSFGGFLAALAVLRRPDVFHAAVAGAPVTDQRLYDTHWQERFLGHPDEHPAAYDELSLIADAPNLRRPLLLIHGLSDDNVYPVHTLRLSAALLAAGRPHQVLPLIGASHMTPASNTTAELLIMQARFLKEALAG